MGYKKVTLEVLKGKLKSGDYADPTAARRALGRVELSDDEKNKARLAINKHFGVSADTKKAPAKAPAKKAPAKKAPAKKTPAKKATAKKSAAATKKVALPWRLPRTRVSPPG